MYITYERDRWEVINNMGEIARRSSTPLHQSQAIRIDPPVVPPELDEIYDQKKPAVFKPRWLVDISRMALVRGSDICERYYTISYSWNQSGDYFKSSNGEYTRNDEGRHQIISYRKKKTKSHPRGRCKTRIPLKPRLVIFEYLVQQICKDVGARYIWWDQWCINQSNAVEKQEEIKKMHEIYKNAYCTLVLIPELEFIGEYLENTPIVLFDKIMQSEWVKRVWTLEEAFLSRNLLFIGRNVQMWSRISDGYYLPHTDAFDFFYSICTKSLQWNACIALHMVRKRSSTKVHDRYFALANIFSEKMADLNYSYKQNLLDLMLQFYTRLARNDPSILYFGAAEMPDTDEEKTIMCIPENDYLPSWTGITGVHAEHLFTFYQPKEIHFGILPSDFNICDTFISVTCAGIPARIEREYSYARNETLRSVRDFDELLPNIIASHCSSLAFVAASDSSFSFGLKATHFLPLQKDAEILVNTLSSPPTIDGGLLTLTEDCTHCIILFGISYPSAYCHVSPVVTKDGDYYRAIGCCMLRSGMEYPDIDTQTKQTFVIR